MLSILLAALATAGCLQGLSPEDGARPVRDAQGHPLGVRMADGTVVGSVDGMALGDHSRLLAAQAEASQPCERQPIQVSTWPTAAAAQLPDPLIRQVGADRFEVSAAILPHCRHGLEPYAPMVRVVDEGVRLPRLGHRTLHHLLGLPEGQVVDPGTQLHSRTCTWTVPVHGTLTMDRVGPGLVPEPMHRADGVLVSRGWVVSRALDPYQLAPAVERRESGIALVLPHALLQGLGVPQGVELLRVSGERLYEETAWDQLVDALLYQDEVLLEWRGGEQRVWVQGRLTSW